MLKWILHKLFTRMGVVYNYDTTYLHEVTDISAGAALRYFGLPMLSQMRGPSVEVWAGASLGSVLDGDCGPCAQLVVDNSISAGVSAEALRACLRGEYEQAGDVALGFRFANAAIHGTEELDELREAIVSKHGKKALISAAYTSAAARAFPVLKRGLGYGNLCQRLEVDGETVPVKPLSGGITESA